MIEDEWIVQHEQQNELQDQVVREHESENARLEMLEMADYPGLILWISEIAKRITRAEAELGNHAALINAIRSKRQ